MEKARDGVMFSIEAVISRKQAAGEVHPTLFFHGVLGEIPKNQKKIHHKKEVGVTVSSLLGNTQNGGYVYGFW